MLSFSPTLWPNFVLSIFYFILFFEGKIELMLLLMCFLISDGGSTRCRLPARTTSLKISTSKHIITWMIQIKSVHGYPYLFQRTISTFLEHFRAQKTANVIRAKRWWAQRHLYCNEVDKNVNSSPISCSRN